MPSKNRRDPFAGVARPNARHSKARVLRQIAGRMRNILIEKHIPAAEPADAPASDPATEPAGSRETLDNLLASLEVILPRPFNTPTDAETRRAELIATLQTTNIARYHRWAHRLRTEL